MPVAWPVLFPPSVQWVAKAKRSVLERRRDTPWGNRARSIDVLVRRGRCCPGRATTDGISNDCLRRCKAPGTCRGAFGAAECPHGAAQRRRHRAVAGPLDGAARQGGRRLQRRRRAEREHGRSEERRVGKESGT